MESTNRAAAAESTPRFGGVVGHANAWDGVENLKEGTEERMDRTGSPSTTCTNHLDLAAFLLVRGFEVAGVEGETSSLTFVFNDPGGKGEAAMLEFYRGARVPANEYADAQKRVRDLMWEARRGNLGRNGRKGQCVGSNT